MANTPMIERPEGFITPEDEKYFAEQSLTNPILSKFYEFYKADTVNVYKKIYKSMLAKISMTATALDKEKDISDAVDIIVSMGKVPKVMEMFKLLSEGKGYDKLADIQESAAIDGKEIVRKALDKNKE